MRMKNRMSKKGGETLPLEKGRNRTKGGRERKRKELRIMHDKRELSKNTKCANIQA